MLDSNVKIILKASMDAISGKGTCSLRVTDSKHQKSYPPTDYRIKYSLELSEYYETSTIQPKNRVSELLQMSWGI